MTTEHWRRVEDELPDEGVEVDTMGGGHRQNLKRRGRLWFFPDMSMYVYYDVTHWKPVDPAGRRPTTQKGAE